MSFKMTFRWYGNSDSVTLEKIRQIPCVTGIVSAIYDTPVGEVWSNDSILAMKKKIENAGLTFEVVESVPVHEYSIGLEAILQNRLPTAQTLWLTTTLPYFLSIR